MQAYQLGQRFTTAGAPLNGGKAYFYLTTTLTLEDVFEDAGLTTPLANPVVADSSGHFPELVYLDPTKTYRMILKTSADVTISDADPINEVAGSSGVDTADIVDEAVTAAKLGPTAIEDKLGFTPQENFSGLTAHEINVLLGRVGEVFDYMGSSAPSGALELNGGTIGSAASGSSALASADAAELFALLWALNATDSPILDSAGAGATRGANAAADFAANKRLTLPAQQGRFRRSWDDGAGIDTGRRLGSVQADQVGPVTISALRSSSGGSANDSGAPANIMTDDGAGAANTSFITATNTGSETYPKNVAYNTCVRY